MNTENPGRTDQMINSFKDTGTDSLTKWGNEFIQENTPKALNWIVVKIKETVTSSATTSNMKMRDSIRNTIFQGIEIGEANKERALIQAMREVGIDKEQITQVLLASQKYLITRADAEASMEKSKKG